MYVRLFITLFLLENQVASGAGEHRLCRGTTDISIEQSADQKVRCVWWILRRNGRLTTHGSSGRLALMSSCVEEFRRAVCEWSHVLHSLAWLC